MSAHTTYWGRLSQMDTPIHYFPMATCDLSGPRAQERMVHSV